MEDTVDMKGRRSIELEAGDGSNLFDDAERSGKPGHQLAAALVVELDVLGGKHDIIVCLERQRRQHAAVGLMYHAGGGWCGGWLPAYHG